MSLPASYSPAAQQASNTLAARARWSPLEVAFWLAAVASIFLLSSKHLILTEIAILGLFALSLDLILGYAGIVSLGHAAFFGFGAYVAGILAKYGIIKEPGLALLASGLAATVLGFVTSFLVLRGSDLTRLMVTLGVALVLREIANRLDITGGADGLQGFRVPGVLGFKFDMFGKTAYAYALGLLFLCFLVCRRIIHSPFGLALRGIRENATRMPAIGAPSLSHLRKAYTIAAVVAGLAGAALTHTTSTVSLEVLSFGRSADVLVILILGGAGRLYGGIIGAVIYMVARDQFSGINPQYWYFWIGLLLVAVVMFLPNGILGGLSALYKKRQ